MTRARAGIIGTGFMGRVHAHALRANGIPVTRVAGSSPERARSAAAELGADGWSRDAAELIADSNVDVVHICTPNSIHADLTRLALEGGKGVICEKPLAISVADARDLTERAERSGALATVPFVYRFYPAVREARERVRAGDIGRVVLLHGAYLQDWLAAPDRTDWRLDPALGGASRTFADIGVHWCDLAEFVTGHRIVRLSAHTGRAYTERPSSPGSDTEDFVTIQFVTDGGASGSLLASQVSHGRKNALRLSIDGTDAALAFDQESPNELWTGRPDTNLRSFAGSASWTDKGARLSSVPPGHPQGYQDCFNSFVADSYAAREADPIDGLPTFRDGLRAAQLTEAVLCSAREQRWVDLERPDG